MMIIRDAHAALPQERFRPSLMPRLISYQLIALTPRLGLVKGPAASQGAIE